MLFYKEKKSSIPYKTIDSIVKKSQQFACLTAAVLFLAVFLMPCKANAQEYVRVGYYLNPDFQDGAGEGQYKSGYAYEYYQLLSEYTGWKYEYVYGDFPDLYEKLIDGQVDFIAGMAKTADRENIVAFPDREMGSEVYSIIKKSADDGITMDPKSLSGKNVGTIDSAMVNVLESFISENGIANTDISVYSNFENLLAAFDSGEVAAILVQSPNVANQKGNEIAFRVGGINFYIGVNKAKTQLLTELNAAQKKLYADNPNIADDLYKEYLLKNPISDELTPSEKEWVANHKNIAIGYVDNYYPYCDQDENGNVDGAIRKIIPELLREIDIYKHVNVEYVAYPDYQSMVEAINADQIDIMFPAGSLRYFAENDGIYITEPIIVSNMSVVYMDTYDDYIYSSIAVEKTDTLSHYYINLHYPNAELYECDSLEECLDAIKSGKAESSFVDSIRASGYLKNSKYDGIVSQMLSDSANRSFGVKIGNTDLISMLNKSIRLCGSEFASLLSYRYIDRLYEPTFWDFVRANLAKIIVIIAAVASIIFVILFLDARNSKRRNRELEKISNNLENSRNELAENEDILNSAGIGIWHIFLNDGQKPRMKANNQMLTLLGIADTNLSEEVIYDVWNSNIKKSERPKVNKTVEEMMAGKKSEVTYRWIHPTLGEQYVRCGGTSQKVENGYILRGYHYNVNDAVVREQEANRERKLYSDAITNGAIFSFQFDLTEGIIKSDFKGMYDEKSLEAMHLSCPVEYDTYVKAFYERFALKTLSSSSGDVLRKDLLDRYECGESVVTTEYYSRKLNQYHRNEIYMNENEENGHIYALVIGTDITVQRDAEEKFKQELTDAIEAAQEASKAKSTFLFSMSHDIRTPMNAIVGYTDLLSKNLGDEEKARNYIAKIKSSNEFLLSLINNVLEMARIESGKESIDESYWNLSELNDSIMSVFDGQMKTKRIDFVKDIKIDNSDVICDATKVREIILNIIGNAWKFTPEDGQIAVKVTQQESEKEGYSVFKYEISDTGIGMSEDFIPHIFEEFSRERNAVQSNVSGTGLGMPIVKRFVELMGGNITVESKLGQGSKFTVIIPLRLASKEEISKNSADEAEIDFSKFEGKRILLAEDNDLNSEIAIAILGEFGLEVERARDGKECVDILTTMDEDRYNLILMDIQMPNMNGYEATKAIRELPNEKLRNMPIIAMTANAFEEDKKNAYDAGMNGHISKPFATKQLVATLALNL